MDQDQDILSPNYDSTQPQPDFNVSQTPPQQDGPSVAPAGPIAQLGQLPVFPAPQPNVKDPNPGMSLSQLALLGALYGIAHGFAQKNAGAGAAAGADAGAQVAQQNQDNLDNADKAAQAKQEFNMRMAQYSANLHLQNLAGIRAEQQLKNETMQDAKQMATDGQQHIDTMKDVDGFSVYGTGMDQQTAMQKAQEIAKSTGQPLKYEITGVTADDSGKPQYTYTLYNPGDPNGQHTVTQSDLDYFKSRNIPLPQGLTVGAKVGPGYMSKLQTQAKVNYIQDLQLQKEKSDTDTAAANATTAQANAAVAPQMARLGVEDKKAGIAEKQAQTANFYAEAVKNRLGVQNTAEGKMYDTGINPVTKEKLTLANAPDEMLLDEATKQPIPFKMLSTLKPTSQEVNRADFANSVLHSLDQIDQLKANNKLPNGPLTGLTTKALTKAGLSDGDAQKAMNFISFAQSAATGAHVGGRFNVPIMQKMGDMVGINMNDSQFKGAEDSIRDVMQQYSRQGGRMTVGQYKQQTAQTPTQQNATPQSHSFSVSAWQRANPKGDANAAIAAAKSQGFNVVQ